MLTMQNLSSINVKFKRNRDRFLYDQLEHKILHVDIMGILALYKFLRHEMLFIIVFINIQAGVNLVFLTLSRKGQTSMILLWLTPDDITCKG